MMASWIKTRKDCRWLLSRFNKINGRHEETRTPDLYRVNSEVTTLKPFPYLAFPHSKGPKIALKLPSFDGELMASFSEFFGPRVAPFPIVGVKAMLQQ
jgi:hypothetical protein